MEKNLTWKWIFIILLVVVAFWTLYPPQKTLKPGIDLAGGTSLIYGIDTQGIEDAERQNLSQSMITVLRRRIDPANIQNLVWRPQGNTRFEIQMPLASSEAREKRQQYEVALNELLAENIRPAVILRSLKNDADSRAEDFAQFAKDDPNRIEILENISRVYDELNTRQAERDQLAAGLKGITDKLSDAGVNVDELSYAAIEWVSLEEQQLQEKLEEFLGSDKNADLVKEYLKIYSQWAIVTDQLTDNETGSNTLYRQARANLDKFNLTEDQLNLILELPEKSQKRTDGIENLKKQFAERKEKIVKVVQAFDEYRPFQGRLDDAADLQRMLKGAGILEFRILPTIGHPDIDEEEIAGYIQRLKEKGPKYASDIKYIWCELEDIEEWKDRRDVFIAQFGDKFYVLASNKKNEAMLHTDEKQWKLKGSRPTQDQQGRRAISFALDERGGKLFGNITSKNIDRPLCILLDGMAVSAPNIQDRITTQGIITGKFSENQQVDMVNKLNAGSLPARLIEQPISVKTIGPSIGADNRDKGIKSGILGLIVVVACILVYYMLSGAIADVALFMNILLILAAMALLRATFTLPGIAGIILTIGMSVDANVLIYERIREEQLKGSSLRIAIRNGYQRAFRTIFDSNLTTFITAAILYWVASEEIKGFAIVLMLGIVSSMFTALFVTRAIFDLLLKWGVIKDHLFMLRILKNPDVNWMKLRPVFMTISLILIASGLFVFFTRDDQTNNKYDIEFTGGTSVQINLKENVNLTRQDVEDRISQIGEKINNPALQAASVYSIGKSGKQYEINTTETNKTITNVIFDGTSQPALETLKSKLAGKLKNLVVNSDQNGLTIITSEINKSLVLNTIESEFPEAKVSEPQIDEVVNNAILEAFSNDLEIQRNLEPKITSIDRITETTIDSYPELTDYLGGVTITCQIKLPAAITEIDNRLRSLRLKPDMRDLNWYSYLLLDKNLNHIDPNSAVDTFVYVTVEPEAGFREISEEQQASFVDSEKTKLLAATELETSLPRVTQIDPSIGSEAKTRALIAIVLSFFAIVAYIWVRFGNLRYGIAAIAALIHDVCITLGAVTACTYLAGTIFGQSLLISDFKINLAMIAAFLTLIGYSLNDTIVVFDRIRENRHKAQLTAQTINNSINQTLSRTILTSFTTFIVILIMYIFGGTALRGFNFAMAFGIIIGTYSSIAIAAPILLIGANKDAKKGN